YQGLATRGFLVAAIDGRYRGERQNGLSLEAAMLQALRTGKGRPFLIDTAFDLTRLLDYLSSRPDVDPSRIGMSGFSEGGILTWMTAVADDRVRVTAPIIGVTTFGDALKSETGPDVEARLKLLSPVLTEYAMDLGEPAPNARVLRTMWTKLVPGMLDRFDAPHLLPLVAPRPMLVLNHEKDEIFPLDGAQRAVDAARVRYRELNAGERLEFKVSPGLAHSPTNVLQVLGEVTTMMGWMEKWLKTAPAAGN
ncbi:MAG: alpha/beta hydrolase, partial [Armatimonadetes bacterium]|nr:alpha/beta hydrolase [Armatimonadota bacterium]